MAQTNVFITRGCHLIQILKIDYFAGDSMIFTNHNSFTTKDRDYDPDPYMNCAQFRLGAWWYNLCGYSNLNGQYLAGLTTNYTSAHWYYWKNNYYSLKKITMMIKRIRKTD